MKLLILGLSLCVVTGCANLRSTTIETTDPKTGVESRTTKVSVRTFFDGNSEVTKFKNSVTRTTAGTSIGGMAQETSATNVVNSIEAVAAGVAAGMVKALAK